MIKQTQSKKSKKSVSNVSKIPPAKDKIIIINELMDFVCYIIKKLYFSYESPELK